MHIRSPAKSLASCRMMCPAINSTYFTKSSFATNHNQRHADWHVLCPSFSSGTRLPLMSSPVNRNFPIHVYFIVFLERMVPVTADTNSLVDKCCNLGICLFLISICPADFLYLGGRGQEWKVNANISCCLWSSVILRKHVFPSPQPSHPSYFACLNDSFILQEWRLQVRKTPSRVNSDI